MNIQAEAERIAEWLEKRGMRTSLAKVSLGRKPRAAYQVYRIADDRCQSVDTDNLLYATDDYADVERWASNNSWLGGFGVGILNTRTREIDVGFGFGVPCPPPEFFDGQE